MSKAQHPALQAVTPEVTAYDFLLKHGRLPQLDLQERPFAYRGWLLPYLHDCEMLLRKEQSRYAYFFDLQMTDELGDRPIPRLTFCDSPREGPAVMKNLNQCLTICDEMGSWSSLRDFVDWLGFALGVLRRPSDLPDKVQALLYRTLNLQPWIESPYDYLGDLLCEGRKGWNPAGFYPTPHSLCEMMARMTFDEARDHRASKVCDPAVGTGRMLLHASNYSLRLYGQDIDPLCVTICLINAALHVPWLAFPLPDSLFADAESAPSVPPVSSNLICAPEPQFNQKGQGLLFLP
jgi:hypothetical protein